MTGGNYLQLSKLGDALLHALFKNFDGVSPGFADTWRKILFVGALFYTSVMEKRNPTTEIKATIVRASSAAEEIRDGYCSVHILSRLRTNFKVHNA